MTTQAAIELVGREDRWGRRLARQACQRIVRTTQSSCPVGRWWIGKRVGAGRLTAAHTCCIYLVLGLSITLQHALGMDADSDLAKWGEFLQQTNPIKRLVYSRPAHFTYHNGKPLKGTLTYDLAIQDNTFYWRNLTNFPGHPKNFSLALAGMVVGLSPKKEGDQYWSIKWFQPQGEVNIAERQVPRERETVSDAENWGPIAERELGNVRSLGLIGLVPKTFKWIDGRHFNARVFSTKWPADTGTSELTGEIVQLDERSRPVLVKVTCPEYFKTPPNQMIVRYTYANREPHWFPSEITTEPSGGQLSTREIRAVELGRANLPPQGYTPSMFLPDSKSSAQPLIYFVSNNVQHVLTPTGPVAIPRPDPQKSPLNLGVLGVFAVIGAFFLMALNVRRRRTNKKL